MDEIKVRLLVGDDISLWKYFLETCPQSTIYYTPEFLTFIEEVTCANSGCLGAFYKENLVGVLPFVIKHSVELGSILNSLAWYGSHGGCLLKNEDDIIVRNALLGNLREIMSSNNVVSSTIILSHTEENHLLSYKKVMSSCLAEERRSQISYLPEKGNDLEDVLLKSFRQKTRNLVRKSLKQKFSIIESDRIDYWEYLYKEHELGCKANGAPAKPWDHYQAIRTLIPRENRYLYVAKLDGKPVAAMLLFRYNKQVEYVTPVVSVDYRSYQPLSFLIFQSMIRLIHDGVCVWNWGGTGFTLTSLHHFKAGWGAEDKKYYYLTSSQSDFLSKFKEDTSRILDAFPYMFIYPLGKL